MRAQKVCNPRARRGSEETPASPGLNFMKSQLEILADAIDEMTDDPEISNRISVLDQVAWEVNKYLIPSSLKLLEIEQLRHLFLSLVESHIRSIQGSATARETIAKVDELRNQALGGNWI